MDLWWSGKHSNHGGNIQVITAPDGWPLWTSQVRPGREHDTTALRAHPEIMPALTAWISDDLPVLGDLGYEGESGTITVAFKKPKGGELTDDQKAHNKTHNGKRAIGERGNSVLKTTFKALRNISLCPPENRHHRQSSPRHPSHRTRPHNMITHSDQPLPGKVHWEHDVLATHANPKWSRSFPSLTLAVVPGPSTVLLPPPLQGGEHRLDHHVRHV